MKRSRRTHTATKKVHVRTWVMIGIIVTAVFLVIAQPVLCGLLVVGSIVLKLTR